MRSPAVSPPLASTPARSASRLWAGRVLLFVGFFAALAAFPVYTPFDSKLTLPTTLSLLREGNIDLDEYAPTFASYRHGLYERDGHLYNYFPLGPSLAAVPMVVLVDGFVRLATPAGNLHPALAHWRHIYDATGSVDLDAWNGPQRLFASALVALAGVVMFVLGTALHLSRQRALLLAALFVFCTPLLSTASRALWQHGPSLLCLTWVLLCLVRAREAPRHAAWAGLPLALAYVMRPTNSLSVLVLSLYVLWTWPRQAWKFFAGALVVAIPWVTVNLVHYGSFLAPYYEPQRLELSASRVAEALAGNLVSPARGLLVFTPVLLMSAWGLWMDLRARTFTRLHAALVTVVVLHWAAISTFPHWWAGHSYGPRFFSDMVPYLVFFLVPVVRALQWKGPEARRGLTATFTVLAVLSLVLHIHGASSRAVYRWNSLPLDVDTHPERLWDWSDPQFLGRR
ncbi:glycosyltransferase family 39 protein [Corallococcus macrosporus]|uniref:Glycosyltransferase RgtA/B/C/D-like domain-containing protein n=1 Tax=Corallococcus macrosporus DSM 14697 TaxID=1189310 RepID=A0A250JM30_9BACT|nr:glycosyltransferase family 39 protein [Corallococcus macrosporus]ATB44708.1 hypothetical protein MYMAC_000279 [Corallococcus macrosporus DSM 14697]